MSRENNLPEFLTDIADTLRMLKNTTDEIPALSFSSEMMSIISNTKGEPVEIATEEEMLSIIKSNDLQLIGKIYKYVGPTTDNFINGEIYLVYFQGM